MKCQKSSIHQKSKISECVQKCFAFLTFEHVRKKRCFFQTKAISPLVSTIILIVFATILGVMVMGWGKDYDPGSPSSCQDVSLKIITLDGKPMACYSDGILYATVENDGNTHIIGVMVSAIGDAVTTNSVDTIIYAAAVRKLQLPINSANIPLKVIIIPMIEKTVCPKNQVEIENIGRC